VSYPLDQFLPITEEGRYTGAIGPIVGGSWRGKPRKQIHASGYVAHSLEASLWSVGRSASFEEAVLLAANLGEDADTTAAITGQLASLAPSMARAVFRSAGWTGWHGRLASAKWRKGLPADLTKSIMKSG
jgi:ADP-ribosyl-[dinitrogen reductase] hydrolase